MDLDRLKNRWTLFCHAPPSRMEWGLFLIPFCSPIAFIETPRDFSKNS